MSVVVKKYKPKGVKDPRKKKIIDYIAKEVRSYPVLVIARMSHINSSFLKEFKKKYHDKIKIIVAKNTLMKLALKKAGVKVPEEMLTGQNALLLANIPLVEVVEILSKEVDYTHVKAGHKTPVELTIPAGSTGLPVSQVGPLLSELGILTSVQRGIVHILKDTHVANPGDEVDPKMAILLLMLGIKPIEMKFVPIVGITDGLLVTGDALEITKEKVMNWIGEAARNADAIAEEAGIITETNASRIIAKAWREALTVALMGGIVGPDTAEEVIKYAVRQALSVMKAAGIEEEKEEE